MSKFSDFEKQLIDRGYYYLLDGLLERLRNPNQFLVLSHILRHYRMHKPKNNLVFYDRAEFALKSGISISTQKRALEKLEELGYITIQYKGMPKKAHYELQYTNIEKDVVPDGSKWSNKLAQNEPSVSSKWSNKMAQNEPTLNNNQMNNNQSKRIDEKFENFFPLFQSFFPDAKDKVLKELFSTMDENKPEDIKEFIEIMVAFHHNREAKLQGEYFKQYLKAFIQELDKFKHETLKEEELGNDPEHISYFSKLREIEMNRIFATLKDEALNLTK
jgi:hypothetical protein